MSTYDEDEVIALKLSVDRPWFAPQLVSGRRTRRYAERLERYSNILSRLYGAIRKVSGSKVVVDSSKHPSHGLVLNAIPDIDLRVIQLVRDSRAVAFSWQRKKRSPAVHWETRYMPRLSPFNTAMRWNLENSLVEVLRYVNAHYRLPRYEDLVNDPRGALCSVLALLGEDRPNLDFISGNKVVLRANHTVSGNPMRFQQGVIEVRPDTEWDATMNVFQRYLVTVLTWPLLLRYRHVGR